jgi:hypothetical protein
MRATRTMLRLLRSRWVIWMVETDVVAIEYMPMMY